jgi:hypothetical protein
MCGSTNPASIGRDGSHLFYKPFSPSDLLKKVRKVLDGIILITKRENRMAKMEAGGGREAGRQRPDTRGNQRSLSYGFESRRSK